MGTIPITIKRELFSFVKTALLISIAVAEAQEITGRPWPRHTIDAASRGADGVRLIDVNTDGRPDVATGWEEGGVIRVYFNPSRVDSRQPWRQVTVGRVTKPEDAVFADLDGDLAFDVVSSTEERSHTMFVHWAPRGEDHYWDGAKWKTEAIPASKGVQAWMFAAPMQVDGRHGPDIVAGGKGPGAALGWMEAPAGARDMAGWKWHAIRPLGWLMSLVTADMDGDGDADLLFSDRRGARSGVYWMENPGAAAAARDEAWPEHTIGSVGREVMFLDYADFDGDRQLDVLAAVKPRQVHLHRRKGRDGGKWESSTIEVTPQTGTAKAVRLTDVDHNGKLDIIWTSEQATNGNGVIWFPLAGPSQPRAISGPEGVKYDLIELIDLDGDQDLDVLTTEEARSLGVIWYENPGAVANARD